MSIDDDYFDIEYGIREGEFPDKWVKPLERILAALTEEERTNMALRDKATRIEGMVDGLIMEVAAARQDVKYAKKSRDRLRAKIKSNLKQINGEKEC